MAVEKGKKKTSSKKTINKDTKNKKKKVMGSRVKDEISAIIIIAIGIFFAIAMQTSAAGEFGVIVKNIFMGFFSGIALILPYYLILYGILLLLKRASHITGKSVFLLVVTFLMISTIFSGRFIEPEKISFTYIDLLGWFNNGVQGIGGGTIGMFLSLIIMVAVGITGLYIFSVVVIIICLMMLMNTPITAFIENYKLKKMAKEEAREELEKQRKEEEKELEKQKKQKKDIYKEKIKENMENKIEKLSQNSNVMEIAVESLSVEQKSNHFEEEKEVEKGLIENNQKEQLEYDKLKYGLEEKEVLPTGFGLSNEVEYTEINKGKEVFENPLDLDIQEYDNEENVIDNKEASDGTSNSEHTLPMEKKITLKSQEYIFPQITLLQKNKAHKSQSKASLVEKAEQLEQTLKNFKVDAKVVNVTEGPAVTRYEIQPNTGVKVNSIVRLADDIALNLRAKNIRIEAPIPGKAAVGIEVENDNVSMVGIREIIESKEYKSSKSKITFVVGKDIAGNAVVADLKTMPHMLIAGATGSGKSVCINSIIISMLYKASPEEVKFVLIDPKVVELGNYNGIPHMLIPVVTDPSKAAAALNWAVAEMTERYKKFAEVGVKDLASYNNFVMENEEVGEKLPQIVIIIDELADLMMASPSQVEEAICRLAQMARAAGMHLIVATQRPSVDVITGVIKANIPSRIAFAVSSQFDSRTILDMSGAEKLVGKGDMLFNPIGAGKPSRVQGTFISEEEVNKVIHYLKEQNIDDKNNEKSDILKSIEKMDAKNTEIDDTDELLSDAIEAVVESNQVSVSMLQRRFRIGYNRAARIVEVMEQKGIISTLEGSRARQVIWSKEEFEKSKLEMMKSGDV